MDRKLKHYQDNKEEINRKKREKRLAAKSSHKQASSRIVGEVKRLDKMPAKVVHSEQGVVQGSVTVTRHTAKVEKKVDTRWAVGHMRQFEHETVRADGSPGMVVMRGAFARLTGNEPKGIIGGSGK